MTKTTTEHLQILSSDGNDTHRNGLRATAGPDLGLCQGHTRPGYYIWAKRMRLCGPSLQTNLPMQ